MTFQKKPIVDMAFQKKPIIDVEQLTKTTEKLDPSRRLQITINVSEPEKWQGFDRYYSNTIRVRYPNLRRVEGEPHKIEDIHVILCHPGYLLTENGHSYLYSLTNMKAIERLVSDYEEFGDVKLIRNDLHQFKAMKEEEVSLVYHDGRKYDIKTKLFSYTH